MRAFIEPEDTGHLRIIDRAKDVGQTASDESLFAPKYVENKLKFFPEHSGSGGVWKRSG